jgi:arsenite methyltransferase
MMRLNQAEYVQYLRRYGIKDVQIYNNISRDAVLKVVTFGSFAPSAIWARKAA